MFTFSKFHVDFYTKLRTVRFLASQICFLAVLLVLPSLQPAQAQPPSNESRLTALIAAAVEQSGVTTSYDPAYVKLTYPNGDVPRTTGVCSDVLIRAFRKIGLDLQKAIHEDMVRHFQKYPKAWGLRKPDANIDHRRVLNLMCFFQRKGWEIPISTRQQDNLPGDIVAWRLDNNLPHIGLMIDRVAPLSGNHLICHNIGQGVQVEDVVFTWKIIGHFRPNLQAIKATIAERN